MYKILLVSLSIFSYVIATSQNYNAELVYQETNINIKSGKLLKTSNYRIRINNRSGEKFTKISIPFSKYNKIKKIEAYIEDSNGKTIKKLKKNDIIERSAISDISFYEDNFVKEFTLKHNRYPYYLSYSYQEEFYEFLYLDYWLPIIDNEVPTKKAVLKIEVPNEFKISYVDKFIEKHLVDTIEGSIKYTWETSYENILEPEAYSPSIYEFMPTVAIVPQSFIYDISGSLENWHTYGNWQYDLNKGLDDLTPVEKKKIEKKIEGVDKQIDKIRKLYHYLQDNTRYVNISIGTGGLKPYPASYVATNKYSDCKALTNYFKAVLDYIGVEAYYTKIYAGDQIREIDKKLPSQQFNHVILYVPLASDTLWLDCTSDFAFGYLGTFDQNRNVLVIKQDSSHFIKTPALSENEVLENRVIKVTSDYNNKCVAKFNCLYRGDKYESLYSVSKSYNESDKSRIIKNFFIEDGFDLLEYKLIQFDRDTAKILLSYSAESAKVYEQYGNDILIRLIPFAIPEFENPKYRKLPVKLDYPVYKVDTVEYKIPSGYKVSGRSENEIISSRFGEYNIEFQQKEGTVVVIKSFILKSASYKLEEYKEFYEFIHQINEIEHKSYIITSK